VPLPPAARQQLGAAFERLLLSEDDRRLVERKYASAESAPSLPAALALWRQAADAVTAREAVLALARGFEGPGQGAGDPGRFFTGLSTRRLGEEKRRAALGRRLQEATRRCELVLSQLLHRHGDLVRFRGGEAGRGARGGGGACVYGDYLEKMENERLREDEAAEAAKAAKAARAAEGRGGQGSGRRRGGSRSGAAAGQAQATDYTFGPRAEALRAQLPRGGGGGRSTAATGRGRV
jgi:hypothetical protein